MPEDLRGHPGPYNATAVYVLLCRDNIHQYYCSVNLIMFFQLKSENNTNHVIPDKYSPQLSTIICLSFLFLPRIIQWERGAFKTGISQILRLWQTVSPSVPV